MRPQEPTNRGIPRIFAHCGIRIGRVHCVPYNPKNVAVVKANGPAIDAIMTKARADMARLPR